MPTGYAAKAGLPLRMGMAVLLMVTTAACGQAANDTDPSATLEAALQAHGEGDLESATKLYEEVITEDPENKFAWYNLGLIRHTQDQVDLAEDGYRKALAIDPDFVPALFNLAILQAASGRVDDAVASYRRVISLQPEYAGAHLNLGFLLIDSGDVAQGKAELRRAVALDPSLESRIPTELAEEVAPPAGGATTATPSD